METQRTGSRSEVLAILLDVLSSNAHHFEREPSALGPLTHNLIHNDYGEVGEFGRVLGRARRSLELRTWLRLDSRSGVLLRRGLSRLLNHGGAVCAVDWAPGSNEVVTASADAVVKVWDARTGALSASHRLPGKQAFALALSPDGDRLALGTEAGIVLLRDPKEPAGPVALQTGRTPVLSVAWNPSGSLLAWAEAGSVLVVEVRNAAFGAVRTIARDRLLEPPLCLRWSPDGAGLALGCRYGWRLWRAGDWSVRRDECGVARSRVTALCWSPSGDELAIGVAVQRDNRMQHGRERGVVDIVTSRGDPARRLDPRSGPVVGLAWSPTRRELAAAFTNERALGVYGVGTGIGAAELAATLRDDTAPLPLENLVVLWDADAGAPRAVLRGHQLPVTALQWAADGERLVSGSADGNAAVWRTGFAEPVDVRSLRRGHLDRVVCAAICPSGSTFATASADTTVRFWDFEGHTPEVEEKGDFGISALGWSPESHYDLVVADVGRRVGRLAHIEEGYFRRSLRIRNLTRGDLVRMPGSWRKASCIAWSPQGDLLAAAGRTVTVWEVARKRRLLSRWARPGVTALAWSSDGRRLAWTDQRGRLTIYDREARAVTEDRPREGPAPTALAWLNERLCAVGHQDGAMLLWDTAERTGRWVTGPLQAAVTCIAYLQARTLVVAGLADASLRLFRLDSGRQELPVFLPSPSLALRARGAELDVVDDGSQRGAWPGAYRFTVVGSRMGGMRS